MPQAPKEGIAFDYSLLIAAPADRVIDAFFDAHALSLWWQTIRSVTTPQPLGVYAIEWEPTTFHDEVLGPLGGVFYGLVVEYVQAREFFVADGYWLPPMGEPLGPMGLEVTATSEGPNTRLRVMQTGGSDGVRWSRYRAVIAPGWTAALRALRVYLEEGPDAVRKLRAATQRDVTPDTPPAPVIPHD